jgi:hypothetical protein
MYTLGMDTIAGSKLLQLKFGATGAFQPDQAVLHGDQRARFVRISDGAAIIRYWGTATLWRFRPKPSRSRPARQR